MFVETLRINKVFLKNVSNSLLSFFILFLFSRSVLGDTSHLVQFADPDSLLSISSDNRVTHYSLRGETYWRSDSFDTLENNSSLAVQAKFNTVFVIDEVLGVHALDLQTGVLQWNRHYGGITLYYLGYPYLFFVYDDGDIEGVEYSSGISVFKTSIPGSTEGLMSLIYVPHTRLLYLLFEAKIVTLDMSTMSFGDPVQLDVNVTNWLLADRYIVGLTETGDLIQINESGVSDLLPTFNGPGNLLKRDHALLVNYSESPALSAFLINPLRPSWSLNVASSDSVIESVNSLFIQRGQDTIDWINLESGDVNVSFDASKLPEGDIWAAVVGKPLTLYVRHEQGFYSLDIKEKIDETYTTTNQKSVPES